jgi:nucleoside-diphosphate-sugar epimerase
MNRILVIGGTGNVGRHVQDIDSQETPGISGFVDLGEYAAQRLGCRHRSTGVCDIHVC